MEIITKRHWRAWNSNDSKESEWALKSGDENIRKYLERLDGLRERLKQRNYRFFKSGLHGARLIAFSIGDGLHLDLEESPTVSITDFYKTSVRIKVLDAEFDSIYELKYGKVTKCIFDFPSDEPLWGNNVDDWGYDEVSEVDEKVLRHEVLFSSGATILIEFEAFSYNKRNYDGSRYSK